MHRLGFTLIEVLIALTVFAILASITSSILYHTFITRSRVSAHAEQLADLQSAILLITRDLAQAVDRPIDAHDGLKATFIGQKNYLEFTRAGLANPHSVKKRSHLLRIAIFCHNNQLIQRHWLTLDAINRNDYRETILLNHLSACQFNYLNQPRQLLDVWHANARRADQTLEPLPVAVNITLTLPHWGKSNWLFIIPKALYRDLS